MSGNEIIDTLLERYKLNKDSLDHQQLQLLLDYEIALNEAFNDKKEV